MKIELRHRKHSSGNQSLYLEYYENRGKRHYESLNLFLVPERTEEDRRVNEATLALAQKIKAERILGIERPVEDDEEPELPRRVFCEWMDQYLEHKKVDDHVSNSHVRTLTSTINILKSYLAYIKRPRMLLSKVDKNFYKNFLIYIKDVYKNTKSKDNPKPLSPKTMVLVQQNMNAMFNYAVKQGLMHRNPFFEMAKSDKLHKVSSDREYLTVEELKQMADVYTGSPQTKQTFMFCCFTGLRHGDMAALTWGNMEKTDLGEVIHVPSMQKTKHPVIVPLGIKAKEWMPERGDAISSDLVFPNAPSIGCADRALKHMAKRAGINKVISFHCSRHTFATMTLTAGSDLLTTSKLLGHQNVQTTTIYADVVMESKVGAVNLTNGLFG